MNQSQMSGRLNPDAQKMERAQTLQDMQDLVGKSVRSGLAAIGGVAAQQLQPQPQSEIGGKFDSLGAAIDNLYGSICQLNQRLSAVMASEAPTPASEGQTKQAQTSCYMASQLDSLRNRVNESSAVLHSILNRLAL